MYQGRDPGTSTFSVGWNLDFLPANLACSAVEFMPIFCLGLAPRFKPSGLPKLAFGKLKTKSHTEKAASLRKLAYCWKHGCKTREEMTDK